MASGRFLPRNPEKYVGDANRIIWRSSWELMVLKWLDSNPGVIKYASEEIAIPYIKPTDGQVHQYYPDFLIVYRDKNGNVRREILEIKPLKESVPEKAKTDRDKLALAINLAKWKSAEAFAKKNGMTFRVLTEMSLFKQKEKRK